MLPYQPGGSALLTARENIRRPPLPSCSTWRLKHLILASDGHGWMIKKTQWYQMNRAHVFLLFVSRYNFRKRCKVADRVVQTGRTSISRMVLL